MIVLGWLYLVGGVLCASLICGGFAIKGFRQSFVESLVGALIVTLLWPLVVPLVVFWEPE